ncbi:ABC transporter permease [Alkalihalobacillus hwajinpoensis]|uniref:ABC transporter permease n=1 Tax=Guptibacillus hwajinpoensis TaxID=208199 RepID=UPI001883AE1B|nr:ABC transporter permease [Pseudalkalibacillus hwajinpoensis]MBF0706150.1 ABC transporter permease [Pseudalkalibacillus hwajinpoensis]
MGGLWKIRFNNYLRHRLKYLSYIMQGGLLIALLLIGAIGIVYYQRLLDVIPEPFPLLFAIALIMSVVLSVLEGKFFLFQADRVFLITCEDRMRQYIKYTFFYSLIRSLPIILIVSLVSAPALIHLEIPLELLTWIYVMILLLFILSFLTIVRSYFTKKKWQRLYLFISNFTILYFTMKGYVFIGALFLMFPITYLYLLFRQSSMLQWERLIELESSQTARFEQFANQFVDVPSLQNKVNPRKYLSWIIQLIPVSNAQTFLFIRIFFRKGSYIWVFIRLVGIGAYILYYLREEYTSYLIVPLLLWITHKQLLAIKKEQMRDSFLVILRNDYSLRNMILSLLVIQSILFSIVQLPSLQHSFCTLVEGLLISFFLENKKQRKS